MQSSSCVTFVNVGSVSEDEIRQKYVNRSILVSIVATLLAISTVSFADNYYQKKLSEARQQGAYSCQVSLNSRSDMK
jgi:hypothetical protein